MAISVNHPTGNEKEDPLSKLSKFVSIGTSIAGLKKGSAGAEQDKGRIVSDTENMGGAMSRRFEKLKYG